MIPIDQWFSISDLTGLAGLGFVGWQLRKSNQQRESDSLVKVYDINRELLMAGFSDPRLFPILEDAPDADPIAERRYLQMWLNQLSLIYIFIRQSTFNRDLKHSLELDVADFFTKKNMRKHWEAHGAFYPQSFQDLVNGILKKSEPPAAAHVKKSKRGKDHDDKT